MVARIYNRTLLLMALSASFFIFTAGSVFAQAGAGIGIRPALIENVADPGTTQTHEITITNLSPVPQVYYLFAKDIVNVSEGGTPIFAEDGAEKTGFELTDWLTISTDKVELGPGEETQVTLTIDIPENATPGSHFGGMFVSMQPPKLRTIGAAVGYDVANIISIRIAGDAVEKAQIREFATGNYIYGDSVIDFRARIENKGTVLVRPVGPLEINNMFGKRVAMLTFNESKAGIYPGTDREFEITWEGDGPGFGRYEAILSLLYGTQGYQSTISSTVSFWILPRSIIVPALITLGVLLLVVYISVRMYIRSKVRGVSAGSRRIIRQQRRGNGMSALLLVLVVMLTVTALFLLILLILFA